MWAHRFRLVPSVMLALGLALAACGGDDDAGSSSADPPGAPADGGGDGATGADPETGAVRYLSLGDSLTQGVGAPDEATGSFPARLAEEWRGDGCEVEHTNVGVSGYTAEQILAEQVPQIETVSPTVVTFQTGANDIVNGVTVDDYRTNVGAVLDAATGSGARVVVLLQNEWVRAPAAGDYGDVDAFVDQRAEFDDVLREEAEARDVEVVDLGDLYAQEADDGLWVEDGIHPTADVYAGWAEAIADQVSTPCP